MERYTVGSTVTVKVNGRDTEMVVRDVIVYSPENYPNNYASGMAGLVALKRPTGRTQYAMTVWKDGSTSKVISLG